MENHVKLMNIDEKYYVIGGTNYQDRLSVEADKNTKPVNISDSLLGSGSSDMDAIGCSLSTAKVARREFFKLFAILEKKEKNLKTFQNHYTANRGTPCKIEQFDKHPNIDRNVEVKLTVGSGETKKNECIQEFSRLISGCDKSIKIAQMYFHPQKEIADALKEKTKQKMTKITVISPGISKGTPWANRFYAYANKTFLYMLSKCCPSVNLFEYDNGNNIYHKKVTVFTHQEKATEVVLGSYNWGGKSHRDYEMIMTIRNNNVGDKVSDILEKDMEKSKKVNSNIQPSLMTRIIGAFQMIFFPHLVG